MSLPPGPLMLDIAGLELTAEDREMLAQPQVGGLILFTRNYETPDQLQALLHAVREVRPQILVAVDQEGGRVQRFQEGFTRLPSCRALGRLYADDPRHALRAAHDCGWLMAAELRAFDIDLSFAPVLDLDHGRSEVIGDRAFSSDPEIVLELAGAYLSGMHRAGMPGTGKHFPGHGWVVPDSHLELPEDDRPLEELLALDMQPFTRLVAAGLDAIMPAHIVFSQVDHNPVGFSPRWLRELLRGELQFDGVIFSDDLSMKGAEVVGEMPDRVRAALYAGCDMVLVCNDRPGAIAALEYLHKVDQPCSQRLSALCAVGPVDRADLAGDLASRARASALELCQQGA